MKLLISIMMLPILWLIVFMISDRIQEYVKDKISLKKIKQNYIKNKKNAFTFYDKYKTIKILIVIDSILFFFLTPTQVYYTHQLLMKTKIEKGLFLAIGSIFSILNFYLLICSFREGNYKARLNQLKFGYNALIEFLLKETEYKYDDSYRSIENSNGEILMFLISDYKTESNKIFERKKVEWDKIAKASKGDFNKLKQLLLEEIENNNTKKEKIMNKLEGI